MNASALADLRAENARLVERVTELEAEVDEMKAHLVTATDDGWTLVNQVLNWSIRAKEAEAALSAQCGLPGCANHRVSAETHENPDMCALHQRVTVVGSWVGDRHGSAS